ncbi:MAG: glutamine synthetase family protein [Oscillospiraceae bacterium]|jgi:glutamine synthetase|nr:glutamine synthetase family protein [Oscillospiraceae bacterium]
MLYSISEVLDYVREEDVKFVRLAFCDVFGTPKNVSVLAAELETAFRSGVSIDASAIAGFGGAGYSDLFLIPDSTTLSVLPWRPTHGRVVRMYCDVAKPGGERFEMDPRGILKKAVAAAAEKGLGCAFGTEYEFYLFKNDETGQPTTVPMDRAGYMDMAPEDAGENVRREICLALEEMGLVPEASHHEEGPGQNEIDFRFSDALSAADNSITFKTVVKTIAARSGLTACFDPKPIANACGSGMHINIFPQLHGGGDCFYPFMAGIMEHISEMTLFLNPTTQSYLRLGGHKAPQYISWSPDDRAQLIRFPARGNGRGKIELRSPDASANPYLAYALLIYAGLEGIERGLAPPTPTELDFFAAPEQALAGLKRLPDSLGKAAAAVLEDGAFINKYIPLQVIRAYVSDGR